MSDTTASDPAAGDPFGTPAESAPPPMPPPAPDYTTLSPYKIALIAGLAIATLLPNLFISSLIEERETRQSGVRQ